MDCRLFCPPYIPASNSVSGPSLLQKKPRTNPLARYYKLIKKCQASEDKVITMHPRGRNKQFPFSPWCGCHLPFFCGQRLIPLPVFKVSSFPSLPLQIRSEVLTFLLAWSLPKCFLYTTIYIKWAFGLCLAWTGKKFNYRCLVLCVPSCRLSARTCWV